MSEISKRVGRERASFRVPDFNDDIFFCNSSMFVVR